MTSLKSYDSRLDYYDHDKSEEIINMLVDLNICLDLANLIVKYTAVVYSIKSPILTGELKRGKSRRDECGNEWVDLNIPQGLNDKHGSCVAEVSVNDTQTRNPFVIYNFNPYLARFSIFNHHGQEYRGFCLGSDVMPFNKIKHENIPTYVVDFGAIHPQELDNFVKSNSIEHPSSQIYIVGLTFKNFLIWVKCYDPVVNPTGCCNSNNKIDVKLHVILSGLISNRSQKMILIDDI